ncbi:MAG: hypothetical protein H8E44_13750 [Planctomycetes bacterium]|nr:hypothetical protein [Planctomycetota bacterium]MBL7037901.1 hypothetical protein [Pirellulaceae bacterium]
MLCDRCLEDIRDENERCPTTVKDEIAREVTQLPGDDFDGAQAMMEDLNMRQ